MERCECREAGSQSAEDPLTLECLECAGQAVWCGACGQREWWPPHDRLRALYAAELHRWETGHARVVVRHGTTILREVLAARSAA